MSQEEVAKIWEAFKLFWAKNVTSMCAAIYDKYGITVIQSWIVKRSKGQKCYCTTVKPVTDVQTSNLLCCKTITCYMKVSIV